MSITSFPAATAPLNVALPVDSLFQLSVEQYHEMIRKGIIAEEDPVELLEGYLVRKMPKYPPHCFVTDAIFEVFVRLALVGCFPRGQNPITTSDSEPEPDFSVVRGQRTDFPSGHPGPEHCALVVEVADSSLQRDRTIKKQIYARASVPVYWIVNLIERKIEVYSLPSGPADAPTYGDTKSFSGHDQIPVVIDGREAATIAVAQLLPPN